MSPTGPDQGRTDSPSPERSNLRPRLDPTPLVVARFPAGWWPPSPSGPFVALVAAPDETTVVLPQEALAAFPAPESTEPGWLRITFAGPLPWELVGFLADVANRLATARIPFTSVSGFTTDHVLVRAAQAQTALAVLRGESTPPMRGGVTNP
ncbi:MAG TPA: ACT domain-containing protein [Mycobacteriales bacterium]